MGLSPKRRWLMVTPPVFLSHTEVCLNILVSVVADDLDGVLVRADRTVAAQNPELALSWCQQLR